MNFPTQINHLQMENQVVMVAMKSIKTIQALMQQRVSRLEKSEGRNFKT